MDHVRCRSSEGSCFRRNTNVVERRHSGESRNPGPPAGSLPFPLDPGFRRGDGWVKVSLRADFPSRSCESRSLLGSRAVPGQRRFLLSQELGCCRAPSFRRKPESRATGRVVPFPLDPGFRRGDGWVRASLRADFPSRSCESRSLLGSRAVPGQRRFLLSQELGCCRAPSFRRKPESRATGRVVPFPLDPGFRRGDGWVRASLAADFPSRSCESRSLLRSRTVPGQRRFLLWQEHKCCRAPSFRRKPESRATGRVVALLPGPRLSPG